MMCSSVLSCFIYLVYFVFFFFKQKTAYEMRISDWSSDVCSSDPLGRAQHAHQQCGALGAEVGGGAVEVGAGGGFDAVGAPPEVDEIGRASCRERVCQYV